MAVRWGVMLATAGLVACGTGGSYADASLETDDQKASYGIGHDMGGQLEPASGSFDVAAFMRGFEEALAGEEPSLPQEEISRTVQAFVMNMRAAMEEQAAREAEENQAAGAEYLAENAQKEGVTTTDSGVQYEVLREGDGASPVDGQPVRLHYRGTLIDGTEFDSSYGGEPAQFTVGGLIDGFNEALTLMSVNSHFRVTIPSDLAYGPGGRPGIPPNSVLIFEIELLEIVG